MILYLYYGKIVFWIVGKIQLIFVFLIIFRLKNNLYCVNKLSRVTKINFSIVLWGIFQQYGFRLQVNISVTAYVTVDTKLRAFQHKMLSNIFFVWTKCSLNSRRWNHCCVLSLKVKMKLTYISFIGAEELPRWISRWWLRTNIPFKPHTTNL